MQRIIIHNFSAIQNADIEVKKILVLIGEQASGKSTISKLIYFFKSLRDDLFNQIYSDTQREFFDINADLLLPIRKKFYDFFGSTFHLPDFTIKYYYSNDKFLSLTLDKNKKILPEFSFNFLNDNFKNEATQIKKMLQATSKTNNTIHEQLAQEQNKIRYAQRLSSLVNDLFEGYQTDSLYVIAGRNATVSYSQLFEKYFYATVQNSLEEDSKQTFKRTEQTIDQQLMLKFMEKVVKIKDTFKKFGNFEGLIESYAENETEKTELYAIKKQIDKLLKGRYSIDNFGEKIVFNETGEYVYLSNASSGQQEAVRILQDIFTNILDKVKTLRILEEPEAHLFPVAQKHMIELLALMVNLNPENQLVITTHSPYVLTVFNNLLFAKRVVDKNKDAVAEVDEIIPKKYWINSNDFAAYTLGSDGDYCQTIVDTNTKLIEQNYLDDVSEMLGGDFNALYDIHSKAFVRR